MKFLIAVLALGAAAFPAHADEPDFQGRNGAYTVAFSEIVRNDDSTWKGAAVTFKGPSGYIQYFDATFERTDHGTIMVEGDPCKILLETVADANGMDAGWAVTVEPYDDEKTGCEVLPEDLAGTYTPF
ncbi:MAG: hypothetical protein EOP60_09580 [Sphingomonadales bacterium]|nr:MAG: hypothetical protein EOP60_09580 [Sphingomonadales bacterium]